jgi:hypothetical protein
VDIHPFYNIGRELCRLFGDVHAPKARLREDLVHSAQQFTIAAPDIQQQGRWLLEALQLLQD